MTLAELGLKPASRFMLIGTTDQEVAEASRDLPKFIEEGQIYVEKVKPPDEENPEERKIIEKGLPSDVMPVLPGRQRITQPISGLLNNIGAKVRITLKFDQDEIWMSSPARTQKLSFAQIASVSSRPIRQHPGYLLVVSPTQYLHLSEHQVLKLYFFPAHFFSHFLEVIKGVFAFP